MRILNRNMWQQLLYCYLLACYCSRIPSFFINWQKGVPPEGPPPSIIEEFISFLLAPILTPIALFAETALAFVWGDVMPERLVPLLTFIVVALFSWMVLGKKFR